MAKVSLKVGSGTRENKTENFYLPKQNLLGSVELKITLAKGLGKTITL